MLRFLTIGILTSAFVIACSSSDPGGGTPSNVGSCARVLDACHSVDSGSGKAHDCHELAHLEDDAKCGPVMTECVNYCKSIQPGTGGTGGQSHTGGAAGSSSGGSGWAGSSNGGVGAGGAGAAGGGGAGGSSGNSQLCSDFCDCIVPTCGVIAEALEWEKTRDACLVQCKVDETDSNFECMKGACEKARDQAEGSRKHNCVDHMSPSGCH